MLNNRLVMFGVAVLGFVFAATQVPAQQRSFKESVTGAWIVTSVFDEYSNGEKRDNWGGPVKGQLTFGRTG
jgi:hypothetical protein